LKPKITTLKTMNKTERAYADYLYTQQLAKLIIAYHYEPIKLKLADRTYYTPDFLVITPHQFEFHEVKGFMRDDANVKLKVAANKYPWFSFKLVKRQGKQWIIREL